MTGRPAVLLVVLAALAGPAVAEEAAPLIVRKDSLQPGHFFVGVTPAAGTPMRTTRLRSSVILIGMLSVWTESWYSYEEDVSVKSAFPADAVPASSRTFFAFARARRSGAAPK